MFQQINKRLMNLKWYPILSTGILILIGSFVFYQYILLFVRTEGWTGTIDSVQGTSEKPFVLRVLIPFIIRILLRFLPQELETLAKVIMALFFLGFIFILRYLYTSLWVKSILLDLICVAAMVGFIPLGNNNKIYDLPGVFFMTLGLAFLARKKILPYLLIFCLMTLNKETSILLLLVFVFVNFRNLSTPLFGILVVLQLIYYIIIRISLSLIFWDNPGGLTQFHGREFLMAFRYAPIYALLSTFLGILILALLFHRFQEKPRFLRKAILATVPFMVALYFLTGFPFEFRFFYEIYPLILLSLAFLLGRITGLPLESSFPFTGSLSRNFDIK